MKKIEELLSEEKPSAIVVREDLKPVEGETAPFAAPTFAPSPQRKSRSPSSPLTFGQEEAPKGLTVLVDTVESQANRLETIFKKENYQQLVPQYVFVIKGKERTVHINLLDLSHRITDAIVRYSTLYEKIWGKGGALEKLREGDCLEISKIAPTSLLFGFWDSRETGVKWPKLLRSEIWAYGAVRLGRKGQYSPAIFKEFKPEEEWKVYTEVLGIEEMEELRKEMGGEEKFKDLLSTVGLGSVPWPEITNLFQLTESGRIERIGSLHLIGLRSHIGVKENGKPRENSTKILQKYVLGLGLVALTYPQDYALRQSCLLVRKSAEQKIVYADGNEEEFPITHGEALEFAKKAAEEFRKSFGVDFGPYEVEVKLKKDKLKKEYQELKKSKSSEE